MAENGRTATNWRVLSITATAATGESYSAQASDSGWVNGRYAFVFPAALWMQEPAWDVTAGLQWASDFPPEELWAFNGLSLPGPHGVATPRATTNFGAVTASFNRLDGYGPAQRVVAWPDGGREFTAEVRLAGQPMDVGLAVVSAVDDRGREVADRGVVGTQVGTNLVQRTTDYAWSFMVASNAASLNITFAVTHRRFATFRVKPALAP
jgi:hypothetical protein